MSWRSYVHGATAGLLVTAVMGVAVPADAQTFKVGSFVKTAGTPVTFQSTQKLSVNNTTTMTLTAFDPGTGSNRLLVVGLSFGMGGGGVTVKYGAANLALVPGTSGTLNNIDTEMWYLVNPSSTPSNIVATWTGGSQAVVMGAVAFNNVDQTTPVQNGTFATGTSATPAVTITSEVGDMTMDTTGKASGTLAATQTQQWRDTSRSTIKAGGSTAAGTASVTHGWTSNGSDDWVSSGVSIKQVGGQTNVIAHGLGQAPNAIILWTSGSTTTGFASSEWSSFGMSDGTTSYSASTSSADGVTTTSSSRRSAQKALTMVQYGQMLLAEANLTSWDGTNFTLTWTTNNATAYVIHYLVMGGVSAKVVTWKPTAGTGNKVVTGVGFQPNVVFHLEDFDSAALPSSVADNAFMLGVMDSGGKQWATAFNGKSGTALSATARAQRTDAAIEEITSAAAEQTRASFVSMNANGFTVNYTLNGAQNNVYSLAIAGLNLEMGSFNKIVSGATPAFVQQAARQSATAINAQTFPGVSTTGNLIVATVNFDGARTVSSVVDSKGNTYTLAVGPTAWGVGPTSPYHTATYYASNITGGGAAITITATLSGAPASFFDFYQVEYSGVSAVSPLDQVSTATGTGTTLNSGSKTTTQMNELIYGYGAGSAGLATKGATFTARSTWDSNYVADKNVQASGSYSSDGTFASSDTWVAQMATFKGNVQAITGLGFQPSAVFLSSVQDITRAAPVAHARLGIGAGDGTTEGNAAIQDANALATTSVQNFDSTSKIFGKINNSTSTIDAEADLASLDADGFTLNWSTNDAVATAMLYVAFAPLNVTEVRLVAFTGTTYDEGTLVQWRTGSEFNNLGFNVYREVSGVRTKVNPALIAGSGLRAGHGTAVNAVEVYAQWDLDAAAPSGRVVYWLEDLDFNGTRTFHGPMTPVAGGRHAPAPSVTSSRALNALGTTMTNGTVLVTRSAGPRDGGLRVRSAQQAASLLETQWMLAAQAPVKLGIRTTGWYRVSQTDLVSAGLDPTVDPQTLRLYVEGVEQAMRVTTAVNGRFDATGAIEFYGTGLDTPYTQTRVYFLAAGGATGLRIGGGAAADSTALSGPASFWSTLQRKDRSVYFAALRNGDAENWFGPLLSTTPTDLTLLVDHLDPTAPSPAQLAVTLQGVTSTPDGNAGHQVGVLVNGTAVGDVDFQGQANVTQTFDVPAALLREGANTVTLVARGGDTDLNLVDVLRLGYWHTYQADADLLTFTVEPGPITIGGFASPAIRIVDITDPAAVVELPGTVQPEAGGSSAVTVRVVGDGRTLLAFSAATIAAPAFVQVNHPSAWHAASQAHDYLVLSHATFLARVAPLTALREQEGHRAGVVDVEDVYDEFSFGEKTPQALRDFLQWAKASWAMPPKFVVLVGDATVDPRDYAGLGDADFVPSKQVSMAQVALKTASDDWFVDFNGDGLPDIPIGRLSVRTAAQADAVVAKIVSYAQTPPQPWMKQVLLVADQNDVTNFEQFSANLGALLPADYSATTVFRGSLGDAAAHQALTDQVNRGQLLVNYTGHGSVHLWSDGTPPLLQNPFDGQSPPVNDITASWQTATRLPFVVAMNCLNGLFNGVWDEESLAEALQRAPGSGAVAVWASSSTTPAATQALVNDALFRLIFQGVYATVGEAVAAAKGAVSNPDLRRSWIFFGDPAMHLMGAPQPNGLPLFEPSTPAPANGASAIPTDATLSWSAPGATSYDVFFGTTTPPPQVALGLATASYAPRGMAVVHAYYWQIVAHNASGMTTGPLWSFTTGGAPRNTTPPKGDFDGDGKADLAIYRPSSGTWYVLRSSTNDATYGTYLWGLAGDLPVPGDYDGDGIADIAMYRPATGGWYILLSSTGYSTYVSDTWGLPGDQPVPGDYDGDGKIDLAVYRPSTGGWYILQSSTNYATYVSYVWGLEGDVPVPSDYDGDHKTDIAVYRPSNGMWYALLSSTASTTFVSHQWGLTGDLPVPGDYDGDGKTDIAVYRPSTGGWFILLSSTSASTSATYQWGLPGDIPVPGDFDGDGTTDLAAYRPSTGGWYILQSSTNYTTYSTYQFGGLAGDIPLLIP